MESQDGDGDGGGDKTQTPEAQGSPAVPLLASLPVTDPAAAMAIQALHPTQDDRPLPPPAATNMAALPSLSALPSAGPAAAFGFWF